MIEERLVLYRKQDGPPMALCNHHSQPVALLSMGRSDGFTCGYRGKEDRCVQYSHGNGAIPKAEKVQSYPIIDRDGFSWIWMGSPDAASVDLIPDLGPSDVAP
jgi:phenylpropionate dioxygenase-like ring-hydroxylating dioxygenase large terminal subunit